MKKKEKNNMQFNEYDLEELFEECSKMPLSMVMI